MRSFIRRSRGPVAPAAVALTLLALSCPAFLRAAPGDPVVAPPPGQAAQQPAQDQQPPQGEPTKFMRFVDDGKGGGKFETATVSYKNAEGVTVRLVAAVHIGEKSYFENLAKGFEADDAVLYEMVKPKDAVLRAPGAPPEPGAVERQNPIGDMQRMMKEFLNLEFQLDVIDYTKPNFVHADMDAETFERMQAERGEDMTTLMLKQMMKAMSDPEAAGGGADALGGDDPEQLMRMAIQLFTRPDMERQIKVMLARQLDQMEDTIAGLDGPDGSVILTERNKAAMKVLSDTLAAGGKKQLSVFYGAAHMPDLAERLKGMGFQPVATEWNMAWDLEIRANQPSAVERLLMDALDVLDEPALDDAAGAGEEDEGDFLF